jgi:uncharacterized protein (TIGR00251 family)
MEGIRKLSEREYEMHVHASAREGKANRAVIDLLAEYFSVPKSAVRILRGESSRKKLVEIDS